MELFTLGSKDNQEGTETSALFAGTGSDVKIPKKQKRNRFDEIQEKKLREEKRLEKDRSSDRRDKPEEGSQEEVNFGLGEEEVERMKEFARQLSRKMEKEKKAREKEEASLSPGTVKVEVKQEVLSDGEAEGCSPSNESPPVDVKGEMVSDQDSGDNRFVSAPQENLSMSDAQDVKTENLCLSDAQDIKTENETNYHKLLSDALASTSSSTSTQSNNTKWQQNGKKWSIPKKRNSPSEEHDNINCSHSSKTQVRRPIKDRHSPEEHSYKNKLCKSKAACVSAAPSEAGCEPGTESRVPEDEEKQEQHGSTGNTTRDHRKREKRKKKHKNASEFLTRQCL